MAGIKLDKRSVRNITKKLKAMPAKLQKKAIRSSIDPEAKKIANQFKAMTPIGKRKHKNKYAKREGSGFLKKSFTVRNSGRGSTVGRRIVTRSIGFHVFMSPNESGRKAGSRGGHVAGQKKYSTLWKARQRKVIGSITHTLSNELQRL